MKLGYHIIAFINLNVVPDDKPKFYAYAENAAIFLECSCVTRDDSMILKVAFAQHYGAGCFYWPASEVWKDQYPDCIFYPCGTARRGNARRIKFHFAPFSYSILELYEKEHF